MSVRLIGVAVAVILLAVGGVLLYPKPQDRAVQPVREIVLTPEAPRLDVDVNNKFIERFIAEDKEIQAALRGETIVRDASEAAAGDPWAKTNSDILYEQMAPWVYVGFQEINDVQSGRFLNTNTQRKSPWIRVGGTLSIAQIESLDSEKATVRFADATQELSYISETPPPLDPSVPRTPEQVADAQLRYKEFYMKKFIVSGREYDRRRGRPSVVVPSRAEQIVSGQNYLEDYAKKFAERSANVQPPPEALIDASKLDPQQRAVYERYMSLFGRSPQDILEAIETTQTSLQEELETELTGSGAGPGQKSN
jgi:hypothetical protein